MCFKQISVTGTGFSSVAYLVKCSIFVFGIFADSVATKLFNSNLIVVNCASSKCCAINGAVEQCNVNCNACISSFNDKVVSYPTVTFLNRLHQEFVHIAVCSNRFKLADDSICASALFSLSKCLVNKVDVWICIAFYLCKYGNSVNGLSGKGNALRQETLSGCLFVCNCKVVTVSIVKGWCANFHNLVVDCIFTCNNAVDCFVAFTILVDVVGASKHRSPVFWLCFVCIFKVAKCTICNACVSVCLGHIRLDVCCGVGCCASVVCVGDNLAHKFAYEHLTIVSKTCICPFDCKSNFSICNVLVRFNVDVVLLPTTVVIFCDVLYCSNVSQLGKVLVSRSACVAKCDISNGCLWILILFNNSHPEVEVQVVVFAVSTCQGNVLCQLACAIYLVKSKLIGANKWGVNFAINLCSVCAQVSFYAIFAISSKFSFTRPVQRSANVCLVLCFDDVAEVVCSIKVLAVFVCCNCFVLDVVNEQHTRGCNVAVNVTDTNVKSNRSGVGGTVEHKELNLLPAVCSACYFLFNFKIVCKPVLCVAILFGCNSGGTSLNHCGCDGASAKLFCVHPNCNLYRCQGWDAKGVGQNACICCFLCSNHVNVCNVNFVFFYSSLVDNALFGVCKWVGYVKTFCCKCRFNVCPNRFVCVNDTHNNLLFIFDVAKSFAVIVCLFNPVLCFVRKTCAFRLCIQKVTVRNCKRGGTATIGAIIVRIDCCVTKYGCNNNNRNNNYSNNYGSNPNCSFIPNSGIFYCFCVFTHNLIPFY